MVVGNKHKNSLVYTLFVKIVLVFMSIEMSIIWRHLLYSRFRLKVYYELDIDLLIVYLVGVNALAEVLRLHDPEGVTSTAAIYKWRARGARCRWRSCKG